MSFSMFFLLLISDAIFPNAVFPFNVFTFTVFPCAVFRLPYLHKSSLFQGLSQTLKRISLYHQNYFCPKHVKKKPMETWLTHPPKIALNPSPLNIQFCEKKILQPCPRTTPTQTAPLSPWLSPLCLDYHCHYHWLSLSLSLIIMIIITDYHYNYHLCLDVPLCKRGCALSGLHRGRLLAQADGYRWLFITDYWWLLIIDYWWS